MPKQSNKASKKKIRQRLLHKRSQLTTQEQQEKSKYIVNTIKQSNEFKYAINIAFYHAVHGEADPSGLMSSDFTDADKQFFLPIISSNNSLVFGPVDNDTQYKNNQFSIPEPIVDPDELINAESLDLVIMPLLGFDAKGNRLGMGGGYYDRSFAFKKAEANTMVLMGFAYNFQEVDALNTEPWDVGLDIIATESRLVYL